VKTKAILGLAAAVAAGLALAGPVQAQQSVKLGFSLPATSHYGAGAQAFKQEVESRTNGRFTVELFPSNALGGEREMVEGAQLGTVDAVITSTGPVGNFVPATLITDIPFLFRDYAHARGVLDGDIGQGILAECGNHGLVCLAWLENGFRHLTNSRQAVNAPADVQGLKLRTMQNDVHIRAFQTLGAAPTPMAFPELFTALQQGTVDGQENPIPVIVSANFAQVQPHLTLTGHVYSPALLILSPSLWDGLSDADKAVFRDAARKAQEANRAEVDRVEQSGLATLRAAGMQIVTQVDNAAFQQALAPAYADYARRFGQENIDRIRNWRP